MDQFSLRSIGRGASWNYAGHAGSAVTGLIVTALSTRSLGTELFGVYVFIAAVTSLLPLLDFGMRAPVTVAASQTDHMDHAAREDARAVFLSGHGLYLLIGALAAGTILLGGFLVLLAGPVAAEVTLTAVLTGLGMAFSVAMAAMGALCIAALRFKAIALWSLAGQLAYVVIVASLIDGWGLPVLGLGQLVHAIVSKLPIAVWAYSSTAWLTSVWQKPTRLGMMRLGRVALPAFVLGISGQVVSTTDVFILTGLVGPLAVGAYKIGMVIPTQAIGFLYRGVDVIFPMLSGSPDRLSQERLVWQVTTASSAVAGLGMGLLILLSKDAVMLLSGSSSATAEMVLIIFALAWLANVPTHALALLIVARNRQSRIVPVVVIEAVTNLALTMALVPPMGAVGAAVASLSTLAVSNLMVLPIVARDEIAGSCLLRVWVRGVIPALWGVAPAILPFSLLETMHVWNRVGAALLVVGLWALLGGAVGHVSKKAKSW